MADIATKRLSGASGSLVGDRGSSLRTIGLYGVLVPVLLMAALLRFHDLDLQSLWFDELMTWARSNQATPGGVIQSVIGDVWAPGYSLWMWAWIRGVGSSEFLMRFPAALAGVMTVSAMYALGQRLTGDQRVGVFASTLTAILHITVYYSQEARPYAALILYTSLSTYFWLRLMQDISNEKPLRPALALGYAITLLIAAYFNYFGLVLMALQGLGAILWHLAKPGRWVKLAPVFGIVIAGYAPWIPETLNDLRRGSYYLGAPKSFVVDGLTFLHFLTNARPEWVDTLLVVIAAVLVIEGGRMFVRKERIRWGVWALLIGWLVIPFTITYIYSSLAAKSILVDRYLLISFPAWALLLAWTITRLPLPRPLEALMVSGMTMLLVYNLLADWGWGYYHRPTKAQFREATAYVVEHGADLPERPYVIGFDGARETEEHFDYTFEQMGSDMRIDTLAGALEDVPQLETLIGGSHRPRYIWLVSAFNLPSPAFVERLDRDYAIVLHQPLYQAEVWLFEADG